MIVALIAVAVFVGLCLLAVPYGVDSRTVELDGRNEPSWPATPRLG